VLCALAALGSPGCKPERSEKKLTAKQRCRQGCEYRVQCIEEMALNKAVTAANRAHLRRQQQKSHQRFVDFCYEACVAEKPRFQAFARCGVTAKGCEAYYRCESEQISKLKTARPRE
jgi:hypothetical protein